MKSSNADTSPARAARRARPGPSTAYLSTTAALSLLIVASLPGCVDDPAQGELGETTGALVTDGEDAPDSVRITAYGEPGVHRSDFPDRVRITATPIDCPFAFTDAISGDFEAITLRFSESMLTPARRSLRCRIAIDYRFPAGWRFRRPSLTARGAEILGEGQTLAWALRTRLNDQAWKGEFRSTEGPADEFLQIDVASGDELGERPTRCGATSAHIEVDLIGALFAGGTPPDETLGTVDALDTEIDWERCR